MLRYGVEQVDFSSSPRFAVFDRVKGVPCFALDSLSHVDATRHAATLNHAYAAFRGLSPSWTLSRGLHWI